MPPFGENLQREREMRGVSLEEISAATKISVRFLHAIEEEDFGVLPGGVFTRSFIRTYARYLGLDEERVMAEFQLSGQPDADVDMHRMAALRLPIQRSGPPTTLLVLLVAGIMLSAAYLLFRYSRRSIEVQNNPPSAQSHVSAATSPGAGPVTPASGTVTAAGQTGAPVAASGTAPNSPAAAGNTSPTPQSGSQPPSGTAGAPSAAGESAPSGSKQAGRSPGLVLQVAATESAWIGIEADSQTVLQKVLQPNEVKTLRARVSFDITTGNAGGVILTLNGETLKPLGRRGEVKSVHLTHDDLKNPAP